MKIARLVLIGLVTFSGIYLVLPSPKFPNPPPGGLKSAEPADTETVYRQAYFTDLSREEIMRYYDQQFFVMGQFRLNHPPEEAYTFIRDQTQSSFLEEIVHLGRESLFINAYVPTKPTDQIYRNDHHYNNKVTIHLVPSHPITRLTVLGLGIVSIYLIWKHQYV